MKDSTYYDERYYEQGTLTRISCYEQYRWMPETSMRLAMAFIDLVGLQRDQPVLDFGCAKGYLVKALRLLFRDAYGCDHSEYAITRADDAVRTYLRLSTEDNPVPFAMTFHLIMAKDVLEHCDATTLTRLLRAFREKTDRLVAIVPLGDGTRYIIPYMEEEPDHELREREEWWRTQIALAGFHEIQQRYRIDGIKDQWAHYPQGHLILDAR